MKFALKLSISIYAVFVFMITLCTSLAFIGPEGWFDRLLPVASIFIGIISGAFGYYLANFVIAPVIKWNQLRAEVTSTVVFYQNILSAENMNFIEERKKGEAELRRLATEILGVAQMIQMEWFVENFFNVPPLEKIYEASRCLIGLSNTIVEESTSFNRREFMFSSILCLENIMSVQIDSIAAFKLNTAKNIKNI